MLAKQRANSLRHLRQKGKYAVLRVLDYGLSLFYPALMFFYTATDTICLMDNDAHLLMSYIYFCLITMNSILQTCIFPAALRCLLSFCLELFWCCKNHRDGFCMTDGIKENLEATFNNCKSLIEKTANEFV